MALEISRRIKGGRQHVVRAAAGARIAAIGVQVRPPYHVPNLPRVVVVNGNAIVREPFGQQKILARPDDDVIEPVGHAQVDEIGEAGLLRIRSVDDVGPIAINQRVDALPGVEEPVRAGWGVQCAVHFNGRRLRVNFHLGHLQRVIRNRIGQ